MKEAKKRGMRRERWQGGVEDSLSNLGIKNIQAMARDSRQGGRF
jgi:hypothetical protein